MPQDSSQQKPSFPCGGVSHFPCRGLEHIYSRSHFDHPSIQVSKMHLHLRLSRGTLELWEQPETPHDSLGLLGRARHHIYRAQDGITLPPSRIAHEKGTGIGALLIPACGGHQGGPKDCMWAKNKQEEPIRVTLCFLRMVLEMDGDRHHGDGSLANPGEMTRDAQVPTRKSLAGHSLHPFACRLDKCSRPSMAKNPILSHLISSHRSDPFGILLTDSNSC